MTAPAAAPNGPPTANPAAAAPPAVPRPDQKPLFGAPGIVLCAERRAPPESSTGSPILVAVAPRWEIHWELRVTVAVASSAPAPVQYCMSVPRDCFRFSALSDTLPP